MRVRADFCGRADHPAEARHDVEDALLRAERDVFLEPRRAVGARVDPVDRIGKALGYELCSDRRVGSLAAGEPNDPPRAVGIVNREGALVAGTVNRVVRPALTTVRSDRVDAKTSAQRAQV